jgi:probable F420-dependent oxidoreductase
MAQSVRFGFRPFPWLPAGQDPFEVQIELGVEAERLGFDGVFTVDRMLATAGTTDGMVYLSTSTEVFVTLSALAARTSRISIAPLVLVVPFRNPVQLAKITASLDLLSKGRLILPVGQGWNATEFGVLGVNQKQAAGRMEETIEIMRRLWTGKPATFQGKHFQFENIAVEPAPFRPGGPPIWLGSQIDPSLVKPPVTDPRLDRVFARVGRVADAWAPLVYSIPKRACVDPGLLKLAWDRVQESAASAGRPGAVQFAFSHWYYIVESRQDEDAARRHIASFFPGTWEEARNTYLIGTPAQIRDRVRHITRDVDPVSWYIFTALGPDVEQLRRLRADVIPLIEKK